MLSPAISELVLFLRILDAVQRDQWSRPVEGLARICKHSRYFPHQPSAEEGGEYGETPWLCRFLALLSKVGFPRLKLYNLVQEIAEEYCLDTKKGKHQLLSPEDHAEFNRVKIAESRPRFFDNDYSSSHQVLNERARQYNPEKVLPKKVPWTVRFVGKTDVDWFLDREVVIVPKDFETVVMLERLVRRAKGIWNVARKVEDVKFTNEFWQNILIFG